MKDMQFHKESGRFSRRTHWMTLCFACVATCLLNLPEVGHCAAIMVKGQINLNGNSFTVDSYNSTDGQYGASNIGDCGDVICVGGMSNSVPVNANVNIYGRVFTGGTNIYLGTYGGVGSQTWQGNGNTGFELGYLVQNTNFPSTNISFPYNSGLVPPPGTVGTTSYDAVLSGGNYYVNTQQGLGNTIVISPSTLVLQNGYSIESLTIESNASLTIYAGGTNCLMSGNNIVNEGGFPSNFVVYCTSTVTNLSVSGNAPIVGVLIAPNANAGFYGGGNNSFDFMDSLMANSLNLYGHWNFHFDQALLQQGLVPASPSIAANLMSPAISGAGQFQFNVTGVVGSNSVVETSTDLTGWSPVFTNSLPFTFTDTISSGLNQNFYRVVYTQ